MPAGIVRDGRSSSQRPFCGRVLPRWREGLLRWQVRLLPVPSGPSQSVVESTDEGYSIGRAVIITAQTLRPALARTCLRPLADVSSHSCDRPERPTPVPPAAHVAVARRQAGWRLQLVFGMHEAVVRRHARPTPRCRHHRAPRQLSQRPRGVARSQKTSIAPATNSLISCGTRER